MAGSPSSSSWEGLKDSVGGGARGTVSAGARLPRFFVALALLSTVCAAAAAAPQNGYPALADGLDRLTRSLGASVVQVVSYRPTGPGISEGFGMMRLEPYRGTLWATGVVVDAQGGILTTADAAQPGDSIEIRTASGARMSARFLALDPELGLSLVRVNPAQGLAPFRRGGNPACRRGEPLFILHYTAEGLRPALKMGTLVAEPAGPTGPGDRLRIRLGDCHGTAGAAVVDADGHFCGLIVGVRSERESDLRAESYGGEKLEPIEYDDLDVVLSGVLPAAVQRLDERSKRPAGYLGLQADRIGEPRQGVPSALVVVRVLPGSPAELSGILVGDELVEIGGRPVDESSDLRSQVSSTVPGTEVRIKLLRKGVPLMVVSRVGDRAALEWLEHEEQADASRCKRLRRTIQQLQSRLREIDTPAAAR